MRTEEQEAKVLAGNLEALLGRFSAGGVFTRDNPRMAEENVRFFEESTRSCGQLAIGAGADRSR